MKLHSLVLYKNTAAYVTDLSAPSKYTVRYLASPKTETKPAVFAEQNVREKDVLFLADGCSSLESVLDKASMAPSVDDLYNTDCQNSLAQSVKEVWQLLTGDEETKNAELTFNELWELLSSSQNADDAYLMYCAISRTVYFKQNLRAQMEGKLLFLPRPQEEIEALVQKANQKGMEEQEHAQFIERLRQHKLLPEDSRFMGDVEALALGKTDKSRTLHDAHIKETPERAHKLLLETGVWDITRNPYPVRWGLALQSASEGLGPAPEEERVVVESEAYAIDSQWSADPDDAIAFDGKYVWVHIADPASSVLPGSSIDKAARERGATLYIPERTSRMLAEESLSDYALGLSEQSKALSFRIELADDASVADCQVFKTLVKVKRLTYEQADQMQESVQLGKLFEIAQKNLERRKKSGAVQIDLPEVHVSVDPETKVVSITPDVHLSSADLVREMMLLAGEGAAKFAFSNNIPFPFVSQESPDIPQDIPQGLAGQFRLRKCMRKRSVGVTPGMHAGLGIAMYSQVTSPLRRYSDLIAHQQLRAFLDKKPLLDKDTMLLRISEGDAAAIAAHKAERESIRHWTLVYLLQHPEWQGEAICVDKNGRQPQFCIPSLALETFFTPKTQVELNQSIQVKVLQINLSELECDFVQVE